MQIHDRANRIIAGGIFAAMLILGGCGQQPTKGGPPPGGPVEVAVVTVQPKRLVITTELAGRTSASLTAELRPQVNGILRKRLFVEGANVKAGQVLYQIDPAPYQAALDNAQAALGRAEANLPAIRLKADRLLELLAEKAVSQQDCDDVAGMMRQTEADTRYWKAMVDTARINLGYTSITAPISGRIGRSNVTEGALVTAHQPTALATIQQLDPMYVDVPQSTTELLRLRHRLEEGRLTNNRQIQNKVRLLLEDNTQYPLEGALQFRDVTVDPTTGSVILRIVFPNPQGYLLPGMFVRAVLEEGVNPNALFVPQQAVSRNPKGEPYALTVDAEGKVRQRMLKLDRAIGDAWLLSSGLEPGDRVIVEGQLKVRDGASVKVVPFETGDEKKSGASKDGTPPPAKSN
jgi:membrane fusion protein (multidrug efflux system)